MVTPLEKVARALAWREFSGKLAGHEGPEDAGMQERFDAWLAPQVKPFEGDARVAIAALAESEPPERVKANGLSNTWRWMIEQALS